METLYKVKNPTDKDLTILRNGVKYTLPANGELSGIPESIAKFWGEQIHLFLEFVKIPKTVEVKEEVVEETPVEEVEVVETPTEEVEETPVEEVEVEEPTKVVSKKGKK